MDYSELTGKKFAIIAVGEDEKGETEATAFTGKARWFEGHLFLDRNKNKSFQFPDDVLKRIKPVPSWMSSMVLNAEYYIKMSIGPLPEDADPKEYKKTGLKWPKK